MSGTTAGRPASFDEQRLRDAARTVRHPLTRALLVLTFTTGVVDAVSFLGLGQVFTANMTGNVVLLGFGIAGGTGLPVLAPVISLASFLLGAALGGALIKRMPARNPGHFVAALVVEVALLGIAATLCAVLTVRPGSASADMVIALLALTMGSRSATVRRIGVPDLTTTVLTMTLTGFASDLPLAGGSGRGTVRRISAVVAMLAGAVTGAVLLKTSLPLPLIVAAGLALATWLVYVPAARRAPAPG